MKRAGLTLLVTVGCVSPQQKGLVVRDSADQILTQSETASGTRRGFHFADGTNFSVGGGTCTIDVWNEDESRSYFSDRCRYEYTADGQICFAPGNELRDLLELDPQEADAISVSGCSRIEPRDFSWCGGVSVEPWPQPPTNVVFFRDPDRVCVSVPHDEACPLKYVRTSAPGQFTFVDDGEGHWEFCAAQEWCPRTPVSFQIVDECQRYARLEARQCFGRDPVVSVRE